MTKTTMRVLISIAVLAVMGGGIYLAVRGAPQSGDKPGEQPGPFKVEGETITATADAVKTAGIELFEVKVTDVPSTLTLSGRTDLDQERVTHVHAQFPGKVVQVGTPYKPLQLGDMVRGPLRGGWSAFIPFLGPDTLCSIESTDLANAKAAYLQADVQLTLDKDNLKRTKELMKKQVLAEKYGLDAEAAVTKDKAVLDAARQQLLVFGLNDTDIEHVADQQGKERMAYSLPSPRWGMIVEKGVVGGELADPTLNLFTVADTSVLWVWGDVYERDRARLKEGQGMKVILTSDPDHPYYCTVKWISPVIDVNTRSIKIRGELDNTGGHLLAQMYATVVVTVDDGKGSMVVPADAVVRKGPQAYVFVVTDSNKDQTTYRRVPVKVEAISAGPGLESLPIVTRNTLARTDGSAAGGIPQLRVLEGLKAGDMIVQSGALGLSNEMDGQQSQSGK